MNIKLQHLYLAWIAIGISLLLQVETFAEDLQIGEIQAAWTRRAGSLGSFHVKCSSIRIEPPPIRELSDSDIASGRTGPRAHKLTSEIWFSNDNIAIEIRRNPDEVPWLPPIDRYVHHSHGCERIHSSKGNTLINATASGAVAEKSGNPMYGLYMVFWPLFSNYSGDAMSVFRFDFTKARVLPGEQCRSSGLCVEEPKLKSQLNFGGCGLSQFWRFWFFVTAFAWPFAATF